MDIKLKSGIGEVLFGMKEKDVKAIYGEPDRQYKDEDNNIVYLYDEKKLRLTFYQEEEYRLGYIVCSAASLQLSGHSIVGQKWEQVQSALKEKGIKTFEKESFDTIDNYFNEDNWVIFQVEYSEVIKVEVGAIINDRDEFEWKFK